MKRFSVLLLILVLGFTQVACTGAQLATALSSAVSGLNVILTLLETNGALSMSDVQAASTYSANESANITQLIDANFTPAAWAQFVNQTAALPIPGVSNPALEADIQAAAQLVSLVITNYAPAPAPVTLTAAATPVSLKGKPIKFKAGDITKIAAARLEAASIQFRALEFHR